MSQQVVLASSNEGKIAEIQAILKDQNIEVISQSHFDVPDVEETGNTFIENAIIKARHATKMSGLPSIADDSGLEVDVINGEPGVYSARYAGLPSNDKNNTTKLLKALESTAKEKRTARFHCVMVFMAHANDPSPLIAHGRWEGYIGFKEAGTNGFGYDPVFYVPEHDCMSAELDPGIKNAISHRATALKQLLPQISDYFARQK